MPSRPTLVLTRPLSATRRLLSSLEQQVEGPISHVISPVVDIKAFGEWPALPDDTDIILTSEQAVRGDLSGHVVHCVGDRTAEVATANGAVVDIIALEAKELLKRLLGLPKDRSFMHLCGSHKAMDVTARLIAEGRKAVDRQVYAQVAQPLSEQARSILEGEQPVVLPLYSPRSARLVGEGLQAPGARLHVIAMSNAVASEWQKVTGGDCEVVEHPTGDAMVRGIVAALHGHAA